MKNLNSRVSRTAKGKFFTKRTVLFSAVALLSTSAFAADTTYPTFKFGMIMRGDLVQNSSDASGKNVATKNFSVGNVRINLSGMLDENTDYRVRYRLSKDSTGTGTNTDHLTKSTDYAYITHKLDADNKVRLGKHFVGTAGGREQDYGGQDVYLYSLVGDNTMAYATGVSLYHKVAGQEIQLTAFNATNSNAKSPADHQNSLGASIGWYGNLSDGMIKPIAGVSYKSGVNGNRSTLYYGAGARVTPNSLLYVEADLLGIRKGTSAQSQDDIKMNSLVLNSRMYLNGGKIQPIAKVFFDKSKQDSTTGTNNFKRQGISLAAEYHPNYGTKKVDWRLHVAFNHLHTKYDSSNYAKANDNTFLTGFDFSF
jgi:hypothetical protein